MKKALFVTYNSINSSLSGGSQCSIRNLTMVSAHYDTIVYEVQNSKIQKLLSIFLGYFPPITYSDSKKILKLIEENEFDVVFFDASLFGKIIKKIKKTSKVKIISFFHNVEYDYISVRFGKKLIKYPYLLLAYFNERETIKNSHCKIALNRRDSLKLETIYGKKPDSIIPITFDDLLTNKDIPKIIDSEFLLFVGSLNRSNLQAVKWFIQEVFVKINSFKLLIVGKDFETLRDELSGENVIVIGTVGDIGAYYNQATAVVSPILSGAGMKVKIAEALMYGKTIFGTQEAFEGYLLVENATITCNTADDFVKKINFFAQHRTSDDLFNTDSRNLFLNNYSHAAAHIKFKEITDRF